MFNNALRDEGGSNSLDCHKHLIHTMKNEKHLGWQSSPVIPVKHPPKRVLVKEILLYRLPHGGGNL